MGVLGLLPTPFRPGKGLLCGACTLQSRHQQTDWRTMAISKSVRFEVFARDAFTCQYCGQRPPDTVLELDHIHPRAKGGSDELLNLITSCWECNRGKAAKVLSEIAPRPDADLMFLRVQQEIAEAKRYLEAKRQRDNIFNKVRIALSETWIELLNADVPDSQQWDVWINKYGFEEVEAAIRICAGKTLFTDLGRGSTYRQRQECGKYISGILKKRREDREANG